MPFRSAFHQRLYVSVGPVCHDGEAAHGDDAGDGCGRLAAEVLHCEVGIRVYAAEEVVTQAGAFLLSDLVGEYWHAVVHLDLVRVDDFAVEAVGEGDGELGLPRGRGTQHEDDLGLGGLAVHALALH